jgi:cytochrome c-type biogenesis protein CcmE
MSLRPSRQRLVLASAAAAAIGVAGLVAAFALEDTAAYFKAPSDIATAPPSPGETIRLGGLVKTGSVGRSADGLTLTFTVTDMAADTPVRYRGLVPDLFREGQGVIATGRFEPGGAFVAEELLAKHDENYMPPEVADALARASREDVARARQAAHPGGRPPA